MIKKFLLLICLFLMLPVWADEQKDNVNPFIFEQNLPPVADCDDSVFLFEPGLYDNNPKPYSVYSGNNFSQLLQGGVEMNNIAPKSSTKEQDLVYKPKNEKLGKVYVGNFPAGSLTRGLIGGYSLYKNDRFGIRNEYIKNLYKDEFARNSVIVSPELYLNKNITLRAFHGQTVERKGSEEGIALEYALNNKKVKFKKIKNLRFEVNASSATSSRNYTTQRFGFNTRYNF